VVMSPDDYVRASGGRRSSSAGIVNVAPIGHNGGPPMLDRVGPVQAWQPMEMDSPLLQEFLRGGNASASGLSVTELTALRNSAYFRSENLIASSIGMLHTFLMRRKMDSRGREIIEKATDHPLYRVLKKRPNC